ncbi:cisd2-a, partial [Symbiodinium pilosum]
MASVKVDPTSLVIGVGLGAVAAFVVAKATMKPTPVNPGIEKASPKVATVKTIKDIEDALSKSSNGKVAFCRCWRSGKFP